MSNQSEADGGLVARVESIASFEHQHTMLSRIQHALHSNPALVPLIVLVLSVAVFVLAWIGQFIGHHIEGRKPSFFKDLQFLLIGPLWLLAAAYRRAGIAY